MKKISTLTISLLSLAVLAAAPIAAEEVDRSRDQPSRVETPRSRLPRDVSPNNRRPPDVNHMVHSEVMDDWNPVIIPPSWHLDLDSGSKVSGTMDFWYRSETATARFLQPENGARFGFPNFPANTYPTPTWQICGNTPMSMDSIDIATLDAEARVCYRTSDGRLGWFEMYVGSGNGNIVLLYQTWE